MSVLSWDKPAQIMTQEQREREFSADCAVPGTYVPNMSNEDIAKWKAKRVGFKAGHPQIEIRKDTAVIVVSLGGGYRYKHYTPEETRKVNIHIASAGPIQWTFNEFNDFVGAVQEARTILQVESNYEQEGDIEKFEDLIGKTLSNVENIDNEELIFTLDNGEKYRLYHMQDCCESVTIEDISGELSSLIGSPILMAEEVSNPPNVNPAGVPIPDYQESFTWTFYKLATLTSDIVKQDTLTNRCTLRHGL